MANVEGLTYEIVDAGDYLKFVVSGKYSIEGLIDFLRDMYRDCMARDKNKAMIAALTVAVDSVSFSDRISMGKAAAEILGNKIKCAMVVRKVYIHAQKIGEVMATN